ncbi:DNA methylase [human gut metagenome]|uniref:DNA methylase n=1 Tax=human gut metagenome TaxID=408170 RepID=K1TVL7_9ZZZZ
MKHLENMGLKQGNILEPSCGVGNFMGLIPESMSKANMYGVELDPVSGRIAKQLYQKNKIAVQGFEETSYPDSFFRLCDRQCSVWSVSGQ